MNLENMELDDLKEYARQLNIKAGNAGREKLIEKIQKAQLENSAVSSVMNDDDLEETRPMPITTQKEQSETLLSSIASAIDDLDESVDTSMDSNFEDLPIDTVIPVKSITFGGLTYKSRSNNAIFRWNQIGAVEYMTVADLNEMNNYKRDFLNRPLVILMDERAVKKFRLTPVYENVAKINNLKQVFASDTATIERTIHTALLVNMRDILVSKTSQMIKSRILVDINVIRLLSRRLSYDFEEILEQ
ncbi:MAG: hypothetical protein K1W19_03210 [Lachnospiraceae bacterium]